MLGTQPPCNAGCGARHHVHRPASVEPGAVRQGGQPALAVRSVLPPQRGNYVACVLPMNLAGCCLSGCTSFGSRGDCALAAQIAQLGASAALRADVTRTSAGRRAGRRAACSLLRGGCGSSSARRRQDGATRGGWERTSWLHRVETETAGRIRRSRRLGAARAGTDAACRMVHGARGDARQGQ